MTDIWLEEFKILAFEEASQWESIPQSSNSQKKKFRSGVSFLPKEYLGNECDLTLWWVLKIPVGST